MTVVCPICQKEWDYHSETESSSCGRRLCERVIEQVLEIEELDFK